MSSTDVARALDRLKYAHPVRNLLPYSSLALLSFGGSGGGGASVKEDRRGELKKCRCELIKEEYPLEDYVLSWPGWGPYPLASIIVPTPIGAFGNRLRDYKKSWQMLDKCQLWLSPSSSMPPMVRMIILLSTSNNKAVAYCLAYFFFVVFHNKVVYSSPL